MKKNLIPMSLNNKALMFILINLFVSCTSFI